MRKSICIIGCICLLCGVFLHCNRGNAEEADTYQTVTEAPQQTVTEDAKQYEVEEETPNNAEEQTRDEEEKKPVSESLKEGGKSLASNNIVNIIVLTILFIILGITLKRNGRLGKERK